MTFKELLDTVEFDKVWKELNRQSPINDEGYDAYHRVFSQLKELTPAQNSEGFRLAVARIEDELEPGTFNYDVFGIKPGDKEHYALEMSPWMEWLSFNVVDKCIETYGVAVIAAHSLYELTFFGYDAAEAEEKIREEVGILNERRKEFEEGTGEYVSWEDVCKELGYVDERTDKEKERERQQMERIMAENKKVYDMVLADETGNL